MGTELIGMATDCRANGRAMQNYTFTHKHLLLFFDLDIKR